MADRLGLEMRLYRNSGTFAVPVWVEIKNVRDFQRNFEKALADVSTRMGQGWRERRGTLRDGEMTFQMLYRDDDADGFDFFETTFFTTPVSPVFEVAAVDGDITVTGTKGVRMLVDLTTWNQSENLEEGVMVDVGIVSAPAPDGEQPQQITIP